MLRVALLLPAREASLRKCNFSCNFDHSKIGVADPAVLVLTRLVRLHLLHFLDLLLQIHLRAMSENPCPTKVSRGNYGSVYSSSVVIKSFSLLQRAEDRFVAINFEALQELKGI